MCPIRGPRRDNWTRGRLLQGKEEHGRCMEGSAHDPHDRQMVPRRASDVPHRSLELPRGARERSSRHHGRHAYLPIPSRAESYDLKCATHPVSSTSCETRPLREFDRRVRLQRFSAVSFVPVFELVECLLESPLPYDLQGFDKECQWWLQIRWIARNRRGPESCCSHGHAENRTGIAGPSSSYTRRQGFALPAALGR